MSGPAGWIGIIGPHPRHNQHRNAETSPLESRALQDFESPDETFAGVCRGSVSSIPPGQKQNSEQH